jgi:hypothetical protein
MKGWVIIGIGAALVIAGLFFIQWYHVKVLKEPDWEGVTGSSLADKIAARLDDIGLFLIALGLVIGLLHKIIARL